MIIEDEIEKEKATELFRDYVGEGLWELNYALRALFGTDYTTEQYVDLAHKKERKEDPRSAEEIKQHVLEELR